MDGQKTTSKNEDLLNSDELYVGIGGDTVYFTIEPSVNEAIINKSNIIAVTLDLHGVYVPFARIHHLGSDMLTNLEGHPQYKRFVESATRILKRGVA
jgi:hypothetical protein